MAKIHPVAAEGFAAGAASYVAGRPEYPPEIETWLNEELGLDSGKTVLDLGAGTGQVLASSSGDGSDRDRRGTGAGDVGSTDAPVSRN